MVKCLVLVVLPVLFSACTPEMRAAMQKAWQDAQKNRTNFYAPQYNYRMPTYTNSFRTVGPVAQSVQPYNLPANPNRTVGPIVNTTPSYSVPTNPNRTVGPIASTSTGGGYSSSTYDAGYAQAMAAADKIYAESVARSQANRQEVRDRYDRLRGSSTKMVRCDKCGGRGRYNHSNYGNTINSQCPVCRGSGQISERDSNTRMRVGVYGY